MEWYIKAFKNYTQFNGRAHRQEYWMFVLINFIISVAASFVDSFLGLDGILSILYSLFVLIPSIAVAVRRLHDIGKNGWMLLVGLIPLIGWVWIIVLLATESQTGDNQYGSNPKAFNIYK